MPDRIYYETALQVPSSEVPEDCAVAQRRLEIARHGGMILLRLGPIVPGPDDGSEPYSVLLSTGHAKKIIETLEAILMNLGR